MMADTDYPLIITILYASIYGVAILITSIICAIKVIQFRKNKHPKSLEKAVVNQPPREIAETKQDDNTDVDSQEEKKESLETEDRIEGSKWYTPIVTWFILFSEKQKMYIALIPYVFDQGTDLGVIFTYYSLWQDASKNDAAEIGSANPKYFFFASIFIIIVHRIISTIAIYRLTRKCTDVLLQCFDLLIIKTIWLNYKLNNKEPTNPQRYLHVLEATFESCPQILLSVGYLFKSEQETSPLSMIYVSVLFSLWSLVGRVTIDDKILFDENHEESKTWINAECRCGRCPCINWRYLFRVFGWRFIEITSRVFLMVLLWLNVGGLGFCIILSFEFIWCCVIAYNQKSLDPLSLMMYLSYFSSSSADEDSWSDGAVNVDLSLLLFCVYRVLSNVIYMIIITVFATVNFEAAQVENASTRRRVTIENSAGLFVLVYTWIANCIWPYFGCFTFEVNNTHHDMRTVRDLKTLCVGSHYQDVWELLEFGVEPYKDLLSSLDSDTVTHSYTDSRGKKHTSIEHINLSVKQRMNKLRIIMKVVDVDQSYMNEKDNLYRHEKEAGNGGSLAHLAAVNYKDTNMMDVLEYIMKHELGDANVMNNKGETALHYIAAYGPLDDIDISKTKILLSHGLDPNLKNKQGQTVYDIVNERTRLTTKHRSNFIFVLNNQ
eukprot:609630_1